MRPKSNDQCFYKREEREIQTHPGGRRPHDDRGNGWSEVATSQGKPATTRSQEATRGHSAGAFRRMALPTL